MIGFATKGAHLLCSIVLIAAILSILGCMHVDPLNGDVSTDMSTENGADSNHHSDTETDQEIDSHTELDLESDSIWDSDTDTWDTTEDTSEISSDSNQNTDTNTDIDSDTENPYSPIPRNVILFIGDGMGNEHLQVASIYKYGSENSLFFEQFPIVGQMTTHSANSVLTDSAASATAMATGHKVNNGVVGLQIPGDGLARENLTEYFASMGKGTGLITTCTVTHATPAGFGSHTVSRNNTDEIAEDYLDGNGPNLLLGGGGSGMTREMAESAGYTVVETVDELMSYSPAETPRLVGQFGVGFLPYESYGPVADLPHIWEMTEHAIRILQTNPDGFFLMVEGGRIDHAGHANNIELLIPEILALEQTVSESIQIQTIEDTLYIVTADHATGGLITTGNNGAGVLPDVEWTTGGHTADPVPIFVTGPGQEYFESFIETGFGAMDNTDVHRILTEHINWESD